jgi:hypothetical protein
MKFADDFFDRGVIIIYFEEHVNKNSMNRNDQAMPQLCPPNTNNSNKSIMITNYPPNINKSNKSIMITNIQIIVINQ